MTTIAAIAERIRREDPLAAKIAEECKKAILEKAKPCPYSSDHLECECEITKELIADHAYLAKWPEWADHYGLCSVFSRVRFILKHDLPDIQFLTTGCDPFDRMNCQSITITFRARQGGAQ